MRNLVKLIALLILFCSTAVAGEIRVTDKRGLTRAIKDISTSATVVITVKGSAPELVLSNVDGLASEIRARPNGKEPLSLMVCQREPGRLAHPREFEYFEWKSETKPFRAGSRMSYVEFYEDSSKAEELSYIRSFASRNETISSIDSIGRAEVLVVGGGIHGACFARLAAFNGLKTVLLEKSDFASGTSSRSSKMAHGGLRYLEMFDFKQVFEGIRARESLFKSAPHIVKPYPFLVPFFKSDWFNRIKLYLGFWLYDLFVRDSRRRARWRNRSSIQCPLLKHSRRDLVGGFEYTDGLMNDTRVVIEEIIAARQEGALCLNYAAVKSVAQQDDGSVTVGWYDGISEEHHEINAGVVVNCAGPWVPELGRVSAGSLAKQVRYSQGSHIIFDQTWEGPALFLPLEGDARYYFVWPHPAGTLVGTTEREVHSLVDDPQPGADEIEEIIQRLRKDLPGSGLDRSSAHYAFAGIRTLAVKSGESSETAKISRRHRWSYSSGILSLLGGKYTSAAWTVEEGLQKLLSEAGVDKKVVSLADRPLPGGAVFEKGIDDFKKAANKLELPGKIIQRVVERYGSRARYFIEEPELMEVVGGELLRGEIEFAIRVEQAQTLEDLMRRRLELEYCSGHGIHLLDEVCGILSLHLPQLNVEKEREKYMDRLEKIQELLANGEKLVGK